MVLLLTAFRLAWPAFAYSIDDDAEAKRTYSFVLTYLVLIASWLALGLGTLAPWLVRVLSSKAAFYPGADVVGLLAFGTTAYAAYIVMAIGVGRARRTQFNWVITGAAALVSIVLNLILVPPYGMVGAAVSVLAAYVTLFLGMTYWAQRVYPVRYQWTRVARPSGSAVALAADRKARGCAVGTGDCDRRLVPVRARAHRLLPAGRAHAAAGALPAELRRRCLPTAPCGSRRR